MMCLPGAARTFFRECLDEFEAFGLDAARWILETGKQDGENYPVSYNHLVHLMTRNDILALCQAHHAELAAEYCGGILATVSEEQLARAYANPALWQLIVEAEARWSLSPGLSEAGDQMLMVVRKKAGA
jgi:hypothetical protein